ncbi:MAG: AsmA family protein, partial [Bacillota bacterium]
NNNRLEPKKIAIYALITIIMIITMTFIFLQIYFNSSRLKKLVVPKLEETIDYEISITDIDLQLWPQLGVVIEDMKVANPAGFSRGSLAELDSFTIAVELVPLLSKEIEVAEIKLSHPRFNLIKKKTGFSNYQNLLKELEGESRADNSSAQSANRGLELKLDDLQVEEGVLHYNNLREEENINLSGINGSTNLIITAKDKKIKTAGSLNISEINLAGQDLFDLAKDELEFSLVHDLEFDWQDNLLSAREFDVSINDFNLKSNFLLNSVEDGYNLSMFKGQVAKSKIDFNALLKSDSMFYFSLTSDLKLEQLVEQLPLKSDYNLAGNFSTDLRGQFDLEEIDTNFASLELLGTANFRDLEVASPKLPVDLKEGLAQINIAPKRIKVGQLQANILDSDWQGEVVIGPWKEMFESLVDREKKQTGEVKIDLTADQINLDQWRNKLVSSNSTNNSQEIGSIRERISDLAINGRLQVEELNYGNLQMEQLNTKFKAADRVIELSNLGLKGAEGEVRGAAKLDLNESEAEYNGNLQIEGVEVNHLLTSVTKFKDNLYGTLELDFDFVATGEDIVTAVTSTTAEGNLAISNTKLSSEKILEQLTSQFSIWDQSELELGTVKGGIKLTDGKLFLNQLKSLADKSEIGITGYSNLAGDLNYKINYLLSPQRSKKLNLKHKELLYANNSQQVELNFDLVGTTTNPQLKLNKSKLEERLNQELENKKSKEQKKAKEKAGEKVEEKKEELKEKVKSLF